jgi:hypothetical protein
VGKEEEENELVEMQSYSLPTSRNYQVLLLLP